MRLVFAYSHYFLRDARGHVYSPGQFPYSVWQRYLTAFDSITVCSRMREIDTATAGKLNLSSGPNVSFVSIPSLSSPIARFTRRPEAARKLRAALQDADALIARGPCEIGTLAIQLAEQQRKPWAIEMVGCPWDSLWNYGHWLGKLYAPYAMWRTRRLVRRAPYVLYVTREFLQKRYPCRGKSVSCSNVEIPGVDDNVLAQRLKTIEIGRTPLKIGLIGPLGQKYKGIDIALEALARIRDRLPPFEFRILGGGNERPWQQLAAQLGMAEYTVFCGTLPGGEAVYKWLDEIDLYIQPSFQEGLPRALIEAMSRGCPALGSTAGGIPELLDKDCLHSPGDSKNLAQIILRSVNDKNWQRLQAQRNFATAKHYTKARLDQIRSNFWREFATDNLCGED